MSMSWVAGAVRAKALARRRLGAEGARALAARSTFGEAVEVLAHTPYGHDVRPGQGLGEAQHAVGASLLWNMRVLSGWLPRGGAEVMRPLAAGFEMANVDEHVSSVAAGKRSEPPYTLGSLGTAWSRLSSTTTLENVAEVLDASPWRVRDARSRREIHLGLRLAWAESVVTAVPEAAGWARAGAALLLVREVALEGRRLPDALAERASALLGPAFVAEISGLPADLARSAGLLPTGDMWVLEAIHKPRELWRAEAGWWRRVERDGFGLLRASGHDRRPIVGAVAVLAADAWRVSAALESAARGGSASALEAFDALA
jgi:hypothetical protein